MEIQDLNMISDFEAGMNCLQNPSLFSRFFPISSIRDMFQVYSLWKWGALILALVATLGGTIARFKLLIVRFCKILDSSVPPIEQLGVDYDSDDDDDDDDSCSSISSEDGDYSPTTPFQHRQPMDEDFSVAGSSCYWRSRDMSLRRRRSGGDDGGEGFSWSDFASGKSVVKLWDSLGLGLDSDGDSSDSDSESVVSIWDLNTDQKINSFSGARRQIPAISTSSPAVVFSAGSNKNNNVLLGAYDTRVGGQVPAVYAEWKPRRGKVAGMNLGGGDKVYLRDDVTGELTVGDLRKVWSPLESVTESDGDTWWDADEM